MDKSTLKVRKSGRKGQWLVERAFGLGELVASQTNVPLGM